MLMNPSRTRRPDGRREALRAVAGGLPREAPDVVSALASCHEKIRTFLAGLDRVVAAAESGDPRVPAAAVQIRRYFAEGLPLHAADEDLSIAPRLIPLAPELAPLFQDLARDHEAIDACIATLVLQLDALAAGRPSPQAVLRATAALLSSLLLPHIEREEAELFPRCASLPPDVQRAITEEIARRRA